MLLTRAGPTWLKEPLAAPASQGDGANVRANTCRARRTLCVGGTGAQRVTRPPYLPQLFAPRLSQSLQDAKVQGKPAQRRLRGDDQGTLPLPIAGSLGHSAEGWCLKSKADCRCDLRLIILWCKGWLMSNEGLGRLGGPCGEGAGWAHPQEPARKGLLP